MENLIWHFFSYFGDISFWLGFSISFVLVYSLLSKKDRAKVEWILTDLIPVVLISYIVTIVLKFVFFIPRPCIGLEFCPPLPSFPSTHSAVAFAFTTIVILNLKNKKHLLLFVLAFLVGFSRIIFNFHTIMDV
ncbi:MAG: phosphatase PAP2 family protein [Candidatus Aenigmarchaeota archaeon]|nr:phosphatase PAP2 family protein [Candidatus Aenigmarchaeota archaeon]MDW8149129.1 phosphatase PAP2 family protein [Candidatus Aenigmarchaeota archaeon]